MNELLLRRLVFTNFRKHKNLTIDFNPQNNWVFGKHETGKTTINAGYLWLFTGKDNLYRTDHEIKHWDEFGKTTDNADVSVEGFFLYNGDDLQIKRTYKEVWKRLKGQPTLHQDHVCSSGTNISSRP